MSPIERARHRAEFRIKWNDLRRNYPQYEIPDFPENTPLDQIHSSWKAYYKRALSHIASEPYIYGLMIFFQVTEAFFINMVGWDMFKNYAEHQMTHIDRYRQIIMEMTELEEGGESVYIQWPPMVRFILFLLFQTALFAAFKWLCDKGGVELAANIRDNINSRTAGIWNPQPANGAAGPPGGPAGAPPAAAAAPAAGPMGGFDLGGIMNLVGGFFGNNGGGGGGNARPARRRPRYED